MASQGRDRAGRGPAGGTSPGVRCALALVTIAAVVPASVAGGAFAPVGVARDLDLDGVTSVFQDRVGLMWIGTREGLALYDGYDVRLFEHDPNDPDSLADNVVRVVYEDRDGDLWVGTNAGGLERMDRATGTFAHHRHDASDPATISHDSVNAVLLDRTGDLWVGTQIGLNRFDRATGRFERIPQDPAIGSAAARAVSPYVYALHEDRAGDLWVATVGGGVYRRVGGTDTFAPYHHDPADPLFDSREKVFSIAESSDGTLWLATEAGPSRIDRESGRLVPVAAGNRAAGGLADPLTTVVVAPDDGTLWVGTWGQGVQRIDLRSGRALEPPLPGSPTDESSRIVAMTVDREGAVWAGTWNGRLLRAEPTRDGFRSVGIEEGLPIADATAVLPTRDGRLWVGTWGRGVLGTAGRDLRFDAGRREPGANLDKGTVLAMAEGRDGAVWLGTMSGLSRFVPGDPAVRRWTHDPGDPHGLGVGYVRAILEDSRGRVWVGVGGSGLFLLRPDGGFDNHVHRPDDPTSLSDDYVTALLEDSAHRIWVGTRSGGLNLFDPERGTFRNFRPDRDDPTSLSHDYVSDLAEAGDGSLWVATLGGGLDRAVVGADGAVRFERFGEDRGLIDDDVRSLAVAPDGDLWIGMARGFARVEADGTRVRNWSSAAGAPSGTFNTGAAACGEDACYLGSSSGVLVVPTGTSFSDPVPSPTVLRSIRTVDRDVIADRPPWLLDTLRVPYGEMLTFEYAVLDYRDVRRHRFEVRRRAKDDWIELGDRRSITFTDLDPGRYEFEARGRDSNGVWSAVAAPLVLDVVPPFWMTAWFRAAAVAGLVGIAIVAHRVRTSALERRNRELVRLKQQREHALDEARRSRDELHDAYDRLRRLTRRLEQAKEDERKRISRELHDEMGQALTAAKINLQLLHPSMGADGVARRIEDTVGLVDRMIGHVRALSLDLRPPLLDDLGLAPAIRGYLEAQAQRSGLDVRARIDDLPPGLPPEIEIATFRTIQEAVTNVVRHARASTVDVDVSVDGAWIEVRVRDDGRGFDVDRALERAVGGHHLGLLGIRERVEGLGGQVTFDSAPGRGAEVRVGVPMNP